MAQRLNITIPDDLHGQLEPLREQLNISKVCTTALQEAVERLTADPDDDDPRVAEILDRLYERGDFWYDRGYSDGEVWARTEATRAQLEYHAGKLVGLSAEELLRHYREQDRDPNQEPEPAPEIDVWFPATKGISDAQIEWITTDQTDVEAGVPGRWHSDVMDDVFDSAWAARGTYLEGWRDAVVELWEKVDRALKQSKGRRRPASQQAGLD